VPYLKDVPGLGKLFSGTNNSNGLEELLIFVTPHVLKKQTQALSNIQKQDDKNSLALSPVAGTNEPETDSSPQDTGAKTVKEAP